MGKIANVVFKSTKQAKTGLLCTKLRQTFSNNTSLVRSFSSNMQKGSS